MKMYARRRSYKMNLLENWIEKIYSEKDITEDFVKRVGHAPYERLIQVELDINCYGRKEHVQQRFYETEWNAAKKNGYYLA